MTHFRAGKRALFIGVFLIAAFVFAVPQARAQTLYASSGSDGMGGGNQIFAIDTATGAGSVVLDNSSGFLMNPQGLAYYAPTGDLFIANAGNVGVGTPSGNIVQFNTRTGATSVFATANTSLDAPQGLAFDNAGNLFATGYNSGTIVSFARNAQTGTLSSTSATFATGLSLPYYLAFDQAGGLFVANPGADTPEIRRYSAANTFTIFETGAIDAPIGFAFAGSTLFASDTASNTIAGFAGASGDFSTRTNADFIFAPTGAGALAAPQSLVYDGGRDALYAANFDSGTISRINASTGAATVLFSGVLNANGLALATPEPPTGLLCVLGAGLSSAGVWVRRRKKSKELPGKRS